MERPSGNQEEIELDIRSLDLVALEVLQYPHMQECLPELVFREFEFGLLFERPLSHSFFTLIF